MGKRNWGLEIVCAGMLLAGSAGLVMAQDAGSAVGARKAAMKQIGGASAKLRQTDADAATLAAAGKTINDSMKVFAANLPAGSGPEAGAETKAKAEIWTDSAGFQAAMDQSLAASDALAKAQDLDAAKTAAAAVGRSCGGCHSKFRT